MLSTASPKSLTLSVLHHLLGDTPPPDVGFRLWDGTAWPDDAPRRATLVLKHPGSLRAMFARGTELALAEAYLAGDFDIEGDVETACSLADVLEHRPGERWRSWSDWLDLLRLPAGHAEPMNARVHVSPRAAAGTLDGDREAVRFHYDLSNEFYRLWLDAGMFYSCAYFSEAGLSLDAAQEAKAHLLCRKLRLKPGQRLLDIGCGWGGLALIAARHYGADVTAITLSVRQAELAAERVAAAGLASRVRVELRDYRELRVSEPFDAIVSVGMSEHVGPGRMPDYFRTTAALLKPGGVFLNHAIGRGVRPRNHRGPSFIDQYVFPASDIPPLPIVTGAAEGAGLEVRDVENLREHYTLTLRHWVRRLETGYDLARIWVSEPIYRTWRLYLAGSAHGFAAGQLALYQVLLVKPDAYGHAGLPLTRRDWYGSS